VNMDRPEKVKSFVTVARLLQKAPGVGPYLANAAPVLDMMDAAAEDGIRRQAERKEAKEERAAERAERPAARTEATAGEVPVAGTRLDHLRAGTALVAGAAKSAPCKALARTNVGGADGSQCLPLFLDALVLTDFQTPGGCPNELVLLAGDPEAPRWFVVVPPGSAASLHGGGLPVVEGDRLTLVARPGTARALSTAASCSATWAGMKM